MDRALNYEQLLLLCAFSTMIVPVIVSRLVINTLYKINKHYSVLMYFLCHELISMFTCKRYV